MRRSCGGLVASGTRGAMAPGAVLAAVALLAAAAAPAGATVGATRDAETVRAALVGSGLAGLTQNPFLTAPPQGSPVGIGDTLGAPAPFPRNGTTYVVLSTGDATKADQPDQPGTFPSFDDGGATPRSRGDSAFDVSQFDLTFGSAAGGPVTGCFGFDLRFLSEEYPSRLGSPYTDTLVAEVDNATAWTAVGTDILAPDNFASLPGTEPLTIKSTGAGTMSTPEAAGTPYGAATGLLHAQMPLASQASHTLHLSLFDHGDRLGDTAVFVDNLSITQPNLCPRGVTALASAPVITAPTIAATVATQTPTLTGTAAGTGAVTARIYAGAVAAGSPVQTLTATRSGNTWSAPAAPLAPGQYTAQATQATATPGVNGVSAPTTFTVVAAGSPAQPGGGSSSQQQTPGDKDNDGIPDDQDSSDGSLPPVPGKTFDARVVSGQVFIKYPPGAGPRAAVTPPKGFVPLKGAANIPMGAQLDTRSGRVAVTSAADTGGAKTQTADFYDGIFQVKQATPKTEPKKPAALITDLVLKGEPSRSECAPLKGSASAAATKKRKRGPKSVLGSLWGNGKGKFRTNGKYSSATVRGTIWLTQDRCDGTLTTVKRGTVSVRDFKRRRTVSVKAGHSYLARAARAATKAKGRTK
jgi:hypothetical protein